MRVFRLEHGATGDGPWNARGLFSSRMAHASPQRKLLQQLFGLSQGIEHPSLWEDWPTNRPYLVVSKHFCGMPSVEAAKHWFGKLDEKLLAQCGFKFRVFEVPDEDVVIGKSQKQVFFKRERAKLVEEKETLHELEAA